MFRRIGQPATLQENSDRIANQVRKALTDNGFTATGYHSPYQIFRKEGVPDVFKVDARMCKFTHTNEKHETAMYNSLTFKNLIELIATVQMKAA